MNEITPMGRPRAVGATRVRQFPITIPQRESTQPVGIDEYAELKKTIENFPPQTIFTKRDLEKGIGKKFEYRKFKILIDFCKDVKSLKNSVWQKI